MSSCKTPYSEMATHACVHRSPYLDKSRGKTTFSDIREAPKKKKNSSELKLKCKLNHNKVNKHTKLITDLFKDRSLATYN